MQDIGKKRKERGYIIGLANFLVVTLALGTFPAFAQQLPSSADPSRIEPLEHPSIPDRPPAKLVIPEVQPSITIPDAAKQVTFTLQQIKLDGMTAFAESELAKIYQPYLNQEVPLASLWMIASQITQLYQDEGYFLSRAYVPAQEIDGGTVTIKVVEGYIADVDIADEALAERALIQQLVKRIKAKNPLNAYDLESFMLQMNALPGEEFRAFIEPIEDAQVGAIRLSLQSEEETGNASVNVDNSGSRFLGPYQASVSYQDSFLPLQQTTFSALTSTPTDELKYAALRHVVPFYPDWELELSGNYVTARPGASLEPNDIQSDAVELGIGVSWQPIRQRQENLILSLQLSGKNSNGDILNNNPLTRDRIRTATGRISYDTNDSWNGYNYISLGVTRGLEILGSSEQGDPNLSRAEAVPDFTTANINYTRQQAITRDFTAIGQLFGQVASDPLFSAQEFGFGGQALGRAYDPSEITGDHGIAGSLELRYQGLASWQSVELTPYGFYDIGRVWNEDSGSEPQSAASAGLGVRMRHAAGVTGDLGIAWPLTKEVDTPIYGDGDDPRLIIQLGVQF